MKIAQISDLHLGRPTWSPLQFFSKRWLGNCNLFLSRRASFATQRLYDLPDFFQENQVSFVLVTGDLSVTSQKSEFAEAKKLLDLFEKKGMQTIAIPGNHDQYTKRAYRQRIFYNYFPSRLQENGFDLIEHGVANKVLGGGWHLIALDTALATSWISSRGLFSDKIANNLNLLLSQIPPGDRVILMNHFPFFEHESPRKTLIHASRLQEIVRSHPQIALYLHGHTHIHCIADLRADGLPIILDSGSTPHLRHGHCHLIDLSPDRCRVDIASWQEPGQKQGWAKERFQEFPWSSGIKTV